MQSSVQSATAPREPRYQWGQRVRAGVDLYNDGSHPEHAPDALLVPAGACGEIVQTGMHVESSTPIYMVEFAGVRHVVGCLEEEITPEAVTAPDPTIGRTSAASRASVSARGPADVQDAQMPRRPGMAESGLDPIGEGATGASLHRAPRLDPIGEGATGASLHRAPRLDPIGE